MWGNQVSNSFIPMTMATMNTPGVYEITKPKEANKDDDFELKYIAPNFNTPNKIYGVLPILINYYWNAFKRHKYTDGLLLTGIAGAGKTETANILANKAIAIGIRCIVVTNITYSPKLMRFLETLDNVIFIFDEFGKIFPLHVQAKFLTLLSNTLGRRRLVILTENNRLSISKFILNRPGRIRYSRDFKKLDRKAVVEYMAEFKVANSFRLDLLETYKTVMEFSFDHLKALVDEHKEVPDLSFKEVLDFLNLDDFNVSKVLALVKTEFANEKDEKVANLVIRQDLTIYNPKTITMDDLNDWHTMQVTIKGYDKSKIEAGSEPEAKDIFTMATVKVSKDELSELIDDTLTFMAGGYRLTFKLVRKEDVPTTIQVNQPVNGTGVGVPQPLPPIFS